MGCVAGPFPEAHCYIGKNGLVLWLKQHSFQVSLVRLIVMLLPDDSGVTGYFSNWAWLKVKKLVDGALGTARYACESVNARSHSALGLNHGQNPSKSDLPWSRRVDDVVRVDVDFETSYSRFIDAAGRGEKIGTASDAAKSFELLTILARGQPRVAHVVKTCNTLETNVIIRVPAAIKTWG